MLAGWGVCAFALVYLQRRMHARYGIEAGLHSNLTTRELLHDAPGRAVRGGVHRRADVLALDVPQSLGRTLAMVTAYAIRRGRGVLGDLPHHVLAVRLGASARRSESADPARAGCCS